jgi:hypothetical protein
LYARDYRNGFHQKFCAQSECRKASKAASQARWRHSEKGRDYFKGPFNVQRVRAWRKAHPGYARGRYRKKSALQDLCATQVLAQPKDTPELSLHALQDHFILQDSLLDGLIANLNGSALQEDIASTRRKLILLGQQAKSASPPNLQESRAHGRETCLVPLAFTPRPQTVQLDRPAPGSG